MKSSNTGFWRGVLLLTVILVPCSLSPLYAGDHSKKPKNWDEGKTIEMDPMDLSPTQTTVGMAEVDSRTTELQAMQVNSDERGIKKYLKDHPVEGVIRKLKTNSGGEEKTVYKMYIVDGHHVSVASHKAGINRVYVNVRKDWSDLSDSEFWEKMKKKDWTYLKDMDTGRAITEMELPRSITELKDSPYRSLAWMVRKAGGYEKNDLPFSEFRWAEVFKKEIPQIDLTSSEGVKAALEPALKLARDPRYSQLPGFIADPSVPVASMKDQKCRELYQMVIESLPTHTR